MRVAHLIRKPLSEGSVARNVLAYGTGGINIDKLRTGGSSPSIKRRLTAQRTGNAPITGMKAKDAEQMGRIDRRGSPEAYMRFRASELLGRWPSNLVLIHHPDCKHLGTKKVKGHPEYPNGPGGKSMHYSSNARGADVRPNPWKGHADSDGTGTVEAWDCYPDCPVREIDGQSGQSTSIPSMRGERHGNIYGGGQGPSGPNTVKGHTDTGGASRFFKQVKP